MFLPRTQNLTTLGKGVFDIKYLARFSHFTDEKQRLRHLWKLVPALQTKILNNGYDVGAGDTSLYRSQGT